MDRAKKHLYCDALLHTDRLTYSHPNLDAYAEQHAASHLHGLSDSHSTAHMDGIAHAHTDYPAPNMDSLADAYTAPDAHSHIHSNPHGDRSTLSLILQPLR